MNKAHTIAVLYHIFYEDSCESVCRELEPVMTYHPIFLFNICSETPSRDEISETLNKKFPGCFIIYTSNKGKDIGAKLALFELLLKLDLQSDYLLLLHDKKSLQALKSSTWKNDLIKIIFPDNINAIMQFFSENKNCGIIATKEYIISEPFENNQFTGVNSLILSDLLQQYNIKVKSFEFVAGTMFWVRAQPLKLFFSRNNPLEIRRSLENGNVIDNFSGTITHSWERMLSWIVLSNGYFIKGI